MVCIVENLVFNLLYRVCGLVRDVWNVVFVLLV